MKPIIITGAAGLIGINLALALNELGRSDLILVDYLNHETKKKNLEKIKHQAYFDREEFLEFVKNRRLEETEAIFHLGACTDTLNFDKEFMFQNNTEYSKLLFEYAIEKRLKFIYASSAATYGNGSHGFNDQERKFESLNTYGQSKYLFDEHVLDSNLKPRQWVGLKFFNVYGSHEEHKGNMASMVYKCFLQARDYGFVNLFSASRPGYDNGGEKRDFIYVKDVVKVILFFFNNEVSGIFNVGTGKARTFLDLASTVFKAMGKEPKVKFFPMPESIKSNYQYFTQAETENLRNAGYKEPFTELEDGVKDYIQNYLEL